ncbi:MAG: hypothetical protein ACXADH_12030 [Candidatus Kariarchaeaceae archaeon]|jgi:hypothetical protein
MFKNKYDTPITNVQVVPNPDTLIGTVDVAVDSTVVQGTGTDFWGKVAPRDFLVGTLGTEQDEEITLTGTSGTANVNVDGVDYLATFNTTLAQTATDFVTTHAAALLAAGITVTAPGAGVLQFVAVIAGIPFTLLQAVNVAPDLASTVVTTNTANVTILEVREIKNISFSSQIMSINAPFSSAIVAQPLLVVKQAQLKTLAIINNGGTDAVVDGNPLPPNKSANFNRDSSNIGGDEYIDPVIIDGTGTTVAVLKIK